MDSNLPLSEQFRLIAKRWVDADTSASILEETKSAVLAKMMLDLGDMAVSKAEMKVKATPDWTEYVTAMTNARSEALKLKVQLEYIRMKFSEWQSHEATRRAEMKI